MEIWLVKEINIANVRRCKRTSMLIKFEAADTISMYFYYSSLDSAPNFILTGSLCVYSQINFNWGMCLTMYYFLTLSVEHGVSNLYFCSILSPQKTHKLNSLPISPLKIYLKPSPSPNGTPLFPRLCPAPGGIGIKPVFKPGICVPYSNLPFLSSKFSRTSYWNNL